MKNVVNENLSAAPLDQARLTWRGMASLASFPRAKLFLALRSCVRIETMPNRSPCARLTIGLLLATAGARAALPEPPKQHDPWTPPVTHGVPEFVVKVAATLFEAGLADPRGGEYREVELPIQRDKKTTVATHAWVFSGGYAVSWNGLVYRIVKAGGRADLDQDVRVIVDVGPWSGRMHLRRQQPPPKAGFWFDLELGEMLAPASICLLLRLGRPDLAELIWKAPEGNNNVWGLAQQRENEEGLWLSTAARAWFGTAYWRLIGAFEGGDDQQAYDVAESIVQWRSRVPDAWRQRNVWYPHRLPDISFLDPAPAIFVDSQRRLHEPVGSKVDVESIAKIEAGPNTRISALVSRLDEVRGAKIAWPGPLFFSFDPVYEQLKKEGEAAVDALLDAYENDQRLTRTFDYSRPWQVEQTPVPVRQVVELLLGDLVGDSSFIHGSAPGELRTWWRQHHSSSRAARSFEVLADDRAASERWLDSAGYITMRSDVQWGDGRPLSQDGEACDPAKPVPPLYGESLRSRQAPSVSELLAARTMALARSNSVRTCRMAVTAALWDSSAALPALRAAAQLQTCRADAVVTAARLTLGDAGAASEWAAEIRNWREFPPLSVDQFAPLWMFPDDPALQQLADWLFTRPEAPWSPALKYEDVYSPLLGVPAYRRAVKLALEDAKVVGKATRSADGTLSFGLDGRASGGSIGPSPSHDHHQAPPGQERPIRVKDLVAMELMGLDGAPEFGLDWPQGDKDAIISDMIQFLAKHEDEVRAFPAHLQDTSCIGQRVYMNGAKPTSSREPP
jgi:hypothetical protein